VTFPPGAVSESTSLAYTLLATPDQALANFRFAGRAFTLTASDSGGNVTTFNQPITITIIYEPMDLVAAGIGNPARLNLVYWDGSAWKTILPCAGCSIDTVNHSVTVVVDHLTEFALVGSVDRKLVLPLVIR
jgi:hypothetical protein